MKELSPKPMSAVSTPIEHGTLIQSQVCKVHRYLHLRCAYVVSFVSLIKHRGKTSIKISDFALHIKTLD